MASFQTRTRPSSVPKATNLLSELVATTGPSQPDDVGLAVSTDQLLTPGSLAGRVRSASGDLGRGESPVVRQVVDAASA